MQELETGTRYAMPEAEATAVPAAQAVINSIAEDEEEGEPAEASGSGLGTRAGEATTSAAGGAGAESGGGKGGKEAAAAAAATTASAAAAEVLSRFKITFLTGQVEAAVCRNTKLAGQMVGTHKPQLALRRLCPPYMQAVAASRRVSLPCRAAQHIERVSSCASPALLMSQDAITVGNYQTQSVSVGLGQTAKLSCVLALEARQNHASFPFLLPPAEYQN